jgi:hypothetical protein
MINVNKSMNLCCIKLYTVYIDMISANKATNLCFIQLYTVYIHMISANKAMKHCCKHNECQFYVKSGSWENSQFFPLITLKIASFIHGDCSVLGRTRFYK